MPRWQHVSYGLDRIKLLLELLGNPQENLKCIHVAGTNGKGSTSTYIESILRNACYKTGLFTSPYIICFEERIKVNNQNIDFESLLRITLLIKERALEVESKLGQHPTEFELMTAIAFYYFNEQNCDICVIEVGLGGRLDSTNLIYPILSIITPIGMDHMNILGDTIDKIAFEKAGIIKHGIPVIMAKQCASAKEVISRKCDGEHCELKEVGNVQHIDFEINNNTIFQNFEYCKELYKTRLLGIYQPSNAALAIEAAQCLKSKGYKITNKALYDGIYQAFIPGRFEFHEYRYKGKNLKIIIDGAHNEDGIISLKNSMQNLKRDNTTSSSRVVGIFGVLKDKDYDTIIKIANTFVDEFVLYKPSNIRALDVDILKDHIDKKIAASFEDAEAALEFATKYASKDDYIVCFGSLYSISQFKHFLE